MPTWGRKTQSRERCFSSSSQIPSAVSGTPPGTAVARALRHRREGGLAAIGGAGDAATAKVAGEEMCWVTAEPQWKYRTFYNIIACFIDIHSKAVYNTIVRHIFGEIWYVVKNAVKQKFIKIISKCYSVGVKTQYIMISK